MSTQERSIVSILDPKIKVDRITQLDMDSHTGANTPPQVPEGINTKDTSRWGAYMPLIILNTNRFDQDQIQSMVVDCSQKVPTLQVSIQDPGGKLALDTPMDGDVISLYLRAPDAENQKPIRIDFDIKGVSSDPSTQNFGFRGVMKIPGLFAEKCKKFPKGSSFDHIQDVCEDIGLGFASNETSTDDIMSRMMPFETYETFIEDTIGHAYKDDKSFWTWYVDPYYYLCMVNINKQFSTEDKLEDVNISMVTPPSGQPNEEQTKDTIKGKLMLTNRSDRAGTNIYIENWSQDNKSAQTWINHGYKRYSQYFSITDDNATEYVSTFVDPLTTEGAEDDAILQKGRPKDDFYKSQIKYKWLGKQSSDNVHENYIFSRLLNFQNLEEIKKVSLNVDMAGMNFYIYRYMRIPVIVYESAGRGANRISKIIDRDKALGEDKGYDDKAKDTIEAKREGEDGKPTAQTDLAGDPRNQIKNEHISGYYLVNSIKYTYQAPGPVKMKLNLIRREWPIPAKNNNL